MGVCVFVISGCVCVCHIWVCVCLSYLCVGVCVFVISVCVCVFVISMCVCVYSLSSVTPFCDHIDTVLPGGWFDLTALPNELLMPLLLLMVCCSDCSAC